MHHQVNQNGELNNGMFIMVDLHVSIVMNPFQKCLEFELQLVLVVLEELALE